MTDTAIHSTNTAGTPSIKTAPILQKPITSVNDRGGQSSDTHKKIAFFILVSVMVLIGLIFSVTKFIQKNKEAKNQENTQKKQAAASETISRRQFVTTDPVMTSPVSQEEWHYLLGADGQPILGADGQPIRIGKDGKVIPSQLAVVPPLTGSKMQAGEAGHVSVPVSRYGGDIVVSNTANSISSPTGNFQNTLNPNNTAALVQDILKSTLGASGVSTEANPSANTSANNNSNTPQTALESMLTPTKTPMMTASKLNNRNMLLPKGRSIDCVLGTKLVSELPGMTTCVLSANVYSDNGRVLLLERGSEATGEYSATTQQGQHRLFVVWDRIKTPHGVVINLNSPGTDSLGTTGLSGEVDNRWGERIGAAFLLSIVKDAISYEVAKTSAQNGNGNSVFAFQSTSQTGDRMAEKVLESTINIKPVIYKNQGDRIAITVARDLDFGTVYALRAQ